MTDPRQKKQSVDELRIRRSRGSVEIRKRNPIAVSIVSLIGGIGGI